MPKAKSFPPIEINKASFSFCICVNKFGSFLSKDDKFSICELYTGTCNKSSSLL